MSTAFHISFNDREAVLTSLQFINHHTKAHPNALNDPDRSLIAHTGGCRAILRILKLYTQDIEIICLALDTMKNLCRNAEIPEMFGSMPELWPLLRNYIQNNNEAIIEHTCAAVSNLSSRNKENTSRMLRHDFAPLICNIISDRIDNEKIVSFACLCVFNLPDDVKQSLIDECQILKLIRSIRSKYPKNTYGLKLKSKFKDELKQSKSLIGRLLSTTKNRLSLKQKMSTFEADLQETYEAMDPYDVNFEACSEFDYNNCDTRSVVRVGNSVQELYHYVCTCCPVPSEEDENIVDRKLDKFITFENQYKQRLGGDSIQYSMDYMADECNEIGNTIDEQCMCTDLYYNAQDFFYDAQNHCSACCNDFQNNCEATVEGMVECTHNAASNSMEYLGEATSVSLEAIGFGEDGCCTEAVTTIQGDVQLICDETAEYCEFCGKQCGEYCGFCGEQCSGCTTRACGFLGWIFSVCCSHLEDLGCTCCQNSVVPEKDPNALEKFDFALAVFKEKYKIYMSKVVKTLIKEKIIEEELLALSTGCVT